MLIEEYFQKIEADIANCPYVFESRILKDKRSLFIGIIDGSIYFIDESVLNFVEFVNVKDKTETYKYSYPTKTSMEKLYSGMIWHPITGKSKPFHTINI